MALFDDHPLNGDTFHRLIRRDRATRRPRQDTNLVARPGQRPRLLHDAPGHVHILGDHQHAGHGV